MTEQEEHKFKTIISEGYTLTSTQCMAEGLRLYAAHFRKFLVYIVIVMGIGIVTSLLWPGIYQIIAYSILLAPVFNAGYYLAADQVVMQKQLQLADFFGGLSRPLPLIACNLIFLLLMAILLSPTYFVLSEAGIFEWYAENLNDPVALANPPQLSGNGPTILMLNLIPVIYLTIAFSWAYPLILFFKTSPWMALEWSRRLVGKVWGKMFVLHFTFVGIILTVALFTNLLVVFIPSAVFIQNFAMALVMPWMYCALYVAFTRVTFAARQEAVEEEE
jgi:hypothetical protein